MKKMKNYLKFIVAVSAFTIAILSSINVNAKSSLSSGSCDSSAATCGKTTDGQQIMGTYSTEQAY